MSALRVSVGALAAIGATVTAAVALEELHWRVMVR